MPKAILVELKLGIHIAILHIYTIYYYTKNKYIICNL